MEVVSDSSVRVSWDRIALPEVTGYRVYYSETGSEEEVFVIVPSSADSVVIGDLLNDVEYQFQVAVIALHTIAGQRSPILRTTVTLHPEATTITTARSSSQLMPATTTVSSTTSSSQVVAVATGVVVFIIVLAIAAATLLALMVYIFKRCLAMQYSIDCAYIHFFQS